MDENDTNLIIGMMQRGSDPPFTVEMLGLLNNTLLQLLSNMAATSLSDPKEAMTSAPYPLTDVCITNDQVTASVEIGDVSDSGCVISTHELLDGVENLMICEKNHCLMHHKDFFPLLLKIISFGGYEEKLAVCKLVWSLDGFAPSLAVTLKEANSMLMLAIQQCHQNDDSELCLLSKCATMSPTSSDDGKCYYLQCSD